MSEEGKAGDIGCGMDGEFRPDPDSAHSVCGSGIQGRHAPSGDFQDVRRTLVELRGGSHDTRTNWLRKHDPITGLGSGVGRDMGWVDQSGYGESELRFWVFHAMSADESRTCFRNFLRSAPQNFRQFEWVTILDRKTEDIHGSNRLTTHRVDVGKRVGSGYLPEQIGIIEDRGKEIECLHQGESFRETVDSGIISRGKADQKICVDGNAEATQDLRELGGPNLRCSTGAANQMGQAWTLIYQFTHVLLFFPLQQAPNGRLPNQ